MSDSPTSEWRLLEIIRERLRALGAQDRTGVPIDVGDDAAALSWGAGDVVVSVDAAVEGVHFRRDWLTLDRIGARAFVAALSDLAAMGSRPRGALVALALPRAMSESEVAELATGLARASAEHGCPIVGGNLTRASELSITTTVLGEGAQHLTRAGARAGDVIFVSGELGASALGLAALRAGDRSPLAASFVDRFAAPVPRIALGLSLVGRATSAIDVSDGLTQDLGHVLDASGVAAEIDVAALPFATGHEELAAKLGLEPRTLALTGGEDYELLFTLPGRSEALAGTTAIGRITEGAGTITLIDEHGARTLAARRGHDHFAR